MPDESGQVAAGDPALAGLRAENLRLRQRLEAMLHEARANQDKLRRFDLLERQVIGAASLAELMHTLLWDYKTQFELDAVTLTLIDKRHEIARILTLPDNAGVATPALLLLDAEHSLKALHGGAQRPLLAPWSAAHAPLFAGQDADLASVALLPLAHRGRLIGSLNLGSRDARRFEPGNSTDFLERLALLVAVCLDSAIATERLKQAGLTDALTGVHNRRYFESRCLEEVSAARRGRTPLVCLFLDIDRFKRLNDTQGHQAGDTVLRYVASLIKVQLRGSDLLARYGGEEFVVLLPATLRAAGLEIAERIRRVVEGQSVPVRAQQSVQVTISIGMAMLLPPAPEGESTALAADLVARADKALYQAKEGGRNRVVCDA